MAKAQPVKDEANGDAAPQAEAAPKGGRKKLLIGAALVLALGGAGLAYATGALTKLTGGGTEHAAAAVVTGSVDLPEIVANLNAGARRTSFARLKVRLELANKVDEAAVAASQPRMLDLFQTYLRDMRPEELRGSAGTYRLREELIARANIALAPARVTEILFIELLVQ
jgi:flagellar FliL protein